MGKFWIKIYSNGYKEMTEEIKIRNDIFDCAKGLGIIFVVMGHAYAFGHDFYTKFHVLFFFFFAGYMFNNYKIIDFYSLSLYIKKIWKRYALPYTFCNIVFLMFFNVFYKYNLITKDLRYSNIHFLSLEELIIKILKYLFLISSSQQLCGATWFLRTLFLGLLIFGCINYIDFKIKKNNSILSIIILIVSSILTIYIKNHFLFVFLTSLNAILIGNIIKNRKSLEKYLNKILNNSLYSFLVTIFSSLMILKTEIIEFKSIQYLFYTVFGTLFLFGASVLLKKIIRVVYNLIVFIGQHTLSILCLHLFAFKLVSYLYIKQFSLNISLLGDFPIISEGITPYYICFYVIIGIGVPLLLEFLYKYLNGLAIKWRNNNA